MNELSDVSMPFVSIDHPSESSPSVSGGIWTATTNGSGPSFWLLSPGYEYSLHIGRDGNNYMQNLKIDTSEYYNLSFRMNYTKPDLPRRLLFYWTSGDLNFLTDPSQAYVASNPIDLLPGWNTYSVDLRTVGVLDSRNMDGWEGQLTGLMLFFIDDTGGSTIQLDWVRLTGETDPLSSNQPVRLTFTAPSYTSGEDYATQDVGNSWDMNDSSDIYTTPPNVGETIDLAGFDFTRGIASFYNTSKDSMLYFKGPATVPIDSSKYRYFTYRFYIEGIQDLSAVGGWVGRVIWYGPLGYSDPSRGYVGDEAVTMAWVLHEGWNEYTIDLATAQLDTMRENHSTWTSVQPRGFRLTPNEGTLSQWMHLDYAKLTARSRADSFFAIQWDLVNPDSDPITTTLYYDTDTDPDNGKTLITTLPTVGVSCSGQGRALNEHSPGISSSDAYTYFLHLPWVTRHYYACSGNCYVWGTSSVAAGDYYVYAELDDGYNVTSWYSETPVEIRH